MKYESFLKSGCLAWTLTSNGYKFLTWNFYLHWKHTCPNHPILILCADKPSYNFFLREGIPCRIIDDTLPDFGSNIVRFGSTNFMTLNRLKLRLLNIFSKDSNIQTCIYLDGDIAIYKNIVEDLQARLQNDPHGLLFQCDENSHDCSGKPNCPNVCTGVIAFRHGCDGGIFVIDNEALWNKKPEDQVWVNGKLQLQHVPYNVLPRDLYPNGILGTFIHSNPDFKSVAFLLHYNYRVGETKVTDMKRFGDWLLPY